MQHYCIRPLQRARRGPKVSPMMEPFLLRALIAGLGIAIVAAPLGCLVVWRRMSYFGSTVAHAGLLGVAFGIAFNMDLTLGVILVSLAVGAMLVVLERQPLLPVDSLLGILSHAALALGLIAAARLSGQRLDLMGYLFGDILAVTEGDLLWVFVGGALVLGAIALFWKTLIAIAVHKELAAAEGHPSEVMDMSFANQFLAVLKLAQQGQTMKPLVYNVDKAQDQEIALAKLQAMGVEIDTLTPAQKAYLEGFSEGT